MRAYVFRHGETEYRQGEVCLEEADDLTPVGIENILANGINVSPHILKDKPRELVIESSPYGRVLHSSKLLQGVFSRSGINVRGIQICKGLEEIQNLDWEKFFSKFVLGGIVELNGEEYSIDAKLTNPQGYRPTRYFRTDSIHILNKSVQKTLPREIIQRIEIIETYREAETRFNRFLLNLNPDNDVHVLVCHEGYTGDFIERAVGSQHGTPYLTRGGFFLLEGEDNDWTPHVIDDNSIQFEGG